MNSRRTNSFVIGIETRGDFPFQVDTIPSWGRIAKGKSGRGGGIIVAEAGCGVIGQVAGLFGSDGLVYLFAGFDEVFHLGQGEHAGGVAERVGGVWVGFDEESVGAGGDG